MELTMVKPLDRFYIYNYNVDALDDFLYMPIQVNPH